MRSVIERAGQSSIAAFDLIEPKSRASSLIPNLMENVNARPATASSGLLIALIVGLAWLLALAWLTLATANPVTLNRFQILNSDFVIRGTFSAGLEDIAIAEIWPPDRSYSHIQLANRKMLHAEPGIEYLVPVAILEQGRFFATPSRLNGQPLIYPANRESLEQLDQILNASRSPESAIIPDQLSLR